MKLELNHFSDKYRALGGRDISSSLNRVIDIFDSRSYFSGSDCRFEIEGSPIDDMVQVGYNLVEPVKFHYGYNRRTRARASRGQRMVSGQLMFNFRDPSQIYYLLNKIKSGQTVQGLEDPRKRQEVLNQLAGSKVTTEKAREMILSTKTSNNVANALRTTNSKPDRDKIEQFRNAMWGVPGATDPYSSYTPSLDARLNSVEGGFDLRIILGEPDFQNPKSQDSSGRQLGSVILISGIELTGESIEIVETGEPIRMVYPFIAADVNNIVPKI